MRASLLFDPNKNSLFYLVLFLALAVLGLTAYDALNGHYSIIGSVASFLGLFVAFQSWKAADEASRNSDQAMQQMHQLTSETRQLAQETRQLVERSNAVEEQIQSAVVTISDATRELYKGFQPIMQRMAEFLEDAAGSEYLALLTDSAAIGTFYARHHRPELNQREMRALTDRIHDLLLDRARDSREFYLATLAADEVAETLPPTTDQHGRLHHFVQGVWQQFHPDADAIAPEYWEEHRAQHQATLRQLDDAFQTLSEHPEQRAAGLGVHQLVPVLPLQLLLRFDAEAKEPFRALVVFLGQYNLDKVAEARALQTTDPELVRTFISMFESLTSLDDHPGYQQLRRQFPL